MTQQNDHGIELTRAWVDRQIVRQLGVSPQLVKRQINDWMSEDAGGGDVSLWTQDQASPQMRVEIIAKQDFILCGLMLMAAVFYQSHDNVPLTLWSRFADGSKVQKGDVILSGFGDARCLLLGERVALNLSARLSGIATKSHQMCKIVERAAAEAQCRSPFLLETRKTTPGLRMYEKFATRTGGVRNHRHGLDTGLMLKENHLRSFGGIAAAVDAARRNAPILTKIEVEVTNLVEYREALLAGADVIMLDNFSMADVQAAVAERAQCERSVALEVSGNITEENVADLAKLGIDFLSSGALIHQATWVDMSLQLHPMV